MLVDRGPAANACKFAEKVWWGAAGWGRAPVMAWEGEAAAVVDCRPAAAACKFADTKRWAIAGPHVSVGPVPAGGACAPASRLASTAWLAWGSWVMWPACHSPASPQVWNVQNSGARGAIVVNFEVGPGSAQGLAVAVRSGRKAIGRRGAAGRSGAQRTRPFQRVGRGFPRRRSRT